MASGLDDLLKGLGAFREGLRDYAVQQGVNEANVQLQELQSQALKDDERLQAQAAVGNQLALKLGAAGAEPGMIAQLTSQLAPSAGAQFQAQENMKLQKSSQAFQSGEAEEKFGRDIVLAQIAAQTKATEKASKKTDARVGLETKQQAEFGQKNKGALEALEAAADIDSLLQPGKNGRIDQAQVNAAMIKLARAAGDTRLSDADLERARANQSVRANILRQIGVKATGSALKDDVSFYKTIAQNLQTRAKSRLAQKARDWAAGFSKSARDDADMAASFQESLLTKYGLADQTAPADAGSTQQQQQDQTGGAGVAPQDPEEIKRQNRSKYRVGR